MERPEFTIQDWLAFHSLDAGQVESYCNFLSARFEKSRLPQEFSFDVKEYKLDFEESLQKFVLPSLIELLGATDGTAAKIKDLKIVLGSKGAHEIPHAALDPINGFPVIHMHWSGSTSDLICLVHEAAHAAQMIMSGDSLMPPMAREVCAFIGELALIAFLDEKDKSIAAHMKAVWHRENMGYFKQDVVDLLKALKDGSMPYAYRQNYPIARWVALALHSSGDVKRIQDLFASGASASEHLGLPSMFGELKSYDRVAYLPRSEANEDITRFKLSLSKSALKVVQQGQIDFEWLYRTAEAGAVVENNIEALGPVPPIVWVKWRSLGVHALAALKQGHADVTPGAFLKRHPIDQLARPAPQTAAEAPWIKPMGFDALTALGMAIQQLASSPYHRQFELSYYLPAEILPPLKIGQLKCYLGESGHPLGLTSWAWLTDLNKEEIHKTGREVKRNEWSGGKHPFINDLVCEPAVYRAIATGLRDSFSPNYILRKVCQWSE